ncbi:MAG: SPOR domain-containing protein [Gammaproteobacteria bacterium]|nr:SPOR domain-containing protein [Gammaproteobacteria bacterium]
MWLSEKLKKSKLLPILAVALLALVIALPLVLQNDGGGDFQRVDNADVPQIDVLTGAAGDWEAPLEGLSHDGGGAGESGGKPETHPSDKSHTTESHSKESEHIKPQMAAHEAPSEDSHKMPQEISHETSHDISPESSHAMPQEATHETQQEASAQASHETTSMSMADKAGKHSAADEHGVTSMGDSSGHVAEEGDGGLSRICYEVGPIKSDAQKNELESLFRAEGMLTSITFKNIRESLGHWVYIPPLRSLALARLKAEEVKLKGIKDVNILIKQKPKYAISLGIFNDPKNANRRLLKAQSLGLNAKLEERFTEENQMWMVLDVSTHLDLSEEEWSKIIKEHKPVELKAINCAL